MRLIAAMMRAALLLVWMTAAALAQEAGGGEGSLGTDYTGWEPVATRAEEALRENRASNAALEALRAEVADWRARFLSAQDTNQTRINTLQAQLDTLGPAPAEGEEEAPDIAARRAELEAQLARQRAPVLQAEEAYSRADGIIREIDAVIREREANRLLTLGPSPLNPLHWPGAAEVVVEAPAAVVTEVAQARGTGVMLDELQANLPAILLLLVIASILLWRGRTWVFGLADFLRNRTRRGTGVWTFLASFGLILVPLLGLVLLVSAANLTGLVGMRGGRVLDLMVLGGAMLLFARWIGLELFTDRGGRALIPLREEYRTEAHWDLVVLGAIVVAGLVVNLAVDFAEAEEPARVVLIFPVIVLAGLMLFRFGRVLSRGAEEPEGEGETPFRIRALRLVAQALVAVGIVGPLLAAIGYVQAAEALVFPTMLSLALLGVVLILQRFLSDLWRFLTRNEEAETDGLLPTLMGFGIFLLSLPIFALIWGARVAELTELWARFQEGFTFGTTRISPADFLTFVIVFVLGYIATRLVQAAMRSSVLPKTKIDPGGQTAIVSGLGYVGIFLAAIVAITATGLDLSSLAIVAGALSVGIGFGLQNIVSNFVSGIILLIERPISEGDWIEVGGSMGFVRSISVRSTRIETFDRTDVIVPNADLVSGTVTNYTRGNTIGRAIVPVGVAYGTDTKRVEGLLRKVAEAHPMVLMNPPPQVFFQGFGADSLDFEIRAILRDVTWLAIVKSDMNHEIARVFAEEGIEIPFAQRDVWLRNPEVLHAAPPKEPPAEAPAGDLPEAPAPQPGTNLTPSDMPDGGGSEDAR